MNATVDRFEDSARSRTSVVNVRLARHADDRRYAIADWTDVSPAHRARRVGIRLLSRHLCIGNRKHKKTKTKCEFSFRNHDKDSFGLMMQTKRSCFLSRNPTKVNSISASRCSALASGLI